MISLAGWLNPTRLIGLTAYLFALASCVLAWAGGHGTAHQRRLAAVIGVLEAALLADMVLNGRWLLHDLLENESMKRNIYADRAGPQLATLIFLGVAALAGVGLVLRNLRNRAGAALAACGAILSVTCWCVEVVSLHSVDLVLYREAYGVKLVGLVWAACSLMTGVGILWDMREVNARARLASGLGATLPASPRDS